MLQVELPNVIRIFVLSIFEWPFYTGFTVSTKKSEGFVCKIHPKLHYSIIKCAFLFKLYKNQDPCKTNLVLAIVFDTSNSD